MNKFKTYLQTALIAPFFSFPALSGSFSSIQAEEITQQVNHPGAELLSEGSYIPGLQTFRLGIKITASKGSHIYWKNPGEIGSPLKISWQLPKGFVVEEEHWPTPKVFEEEGTTFFGYEDSALIVADVRAPEGYTPGQEVELRAQVEWLACGDSCLPGNVDLKLTLPYEEKEPSLYPDTHAEFTKTLHAQPRVLENDHSVQVAQGKGNEIILNISKKINATKAWFVSEKADKLFAYAETSYSGGTGTAWRLKVKNLSGVQKNEKLHGILLLADHTGRPVESLTIHSEVLGQTGSAVAGLSQYITILIMAFLGGVLLNIMPCVLPLVTLKVYGLIKSAGEHRSSVIANGLWFTLGVVGCFWGLAGVAFILKVLGHNIGWGFQLQEPMFVATLIIVFFLFALSSLGLFEMGTMFANLGGKLQSSEMKSSNNKAVGAFFNGILATLVTTPCTGPFLGSVLGLVMSLSFLQQLLIFTAIGLGMASPYLVFSVFPKMLSVLPKPGGWMSTFKQLTGFMLLVTVTWLVWIFGSETSTTSVVVLLGGLWLAGLGAWILGRWGTPVSPKKQRVCASLLFFAFLGGAISVSGLASHYFAEPQQTVSVNEDSLWQPFSLEKLAQLRAQGRPVFVNFTAKWCLTCQMNKPVLYGDAVQKMFETHGIVTLEADWTRKDPGITEELARLGRASVPSYVYYPGDNSAPVVLPEKITQNLLEDVVSRFVR
ncbi:thiol:disulfide interchange protein [Chlamydia pneumoniae TW-183]|uniref:Thiol:disulfide interchange protein n=2 Tax=Chlamydia pneumoniae TaxID=83558 RepID=Q9K1S6_CHLPN|nr:thioredoxin family protein [Chlamydia pneumoniae]AAF38858.1 thiol:disulfide interchange protein DsbD [Chlamydia pneumoniae AR39]AAP98743.1 thiol:disulfide interchange protein [Chlamydia pneumoniae TW-183]CRI33305.1 Thiol:disulfide interchange protein [Chlamydia pneumoniae]CRI36168.1 Thiol:disulfide interchange protein [Chlamydia pneumoniae]CRI37295.1 Thiol:disulfide interchange protein [Chlamydia pneumoniae]